MKVSKVERAKKIQKLLKKEYPAKIALTHKNPLELLVATILSAQCTDKRTNIVTKTLFKKYRTLKDYANADQKTFQQEIRSTGFFRNKAKNIIAASRMIRDKFGGKVPNTMEELTQLPGVARKTANIVLSVGYGKNEGIAVDTHVIRLSKLLGLTKHTDPVKIEKDLMEIFPKKDWRDISLLLIQHGRAVCIARRPSCDKCLLNKLCPSAFKSKK